MYADLECILQYKFTLLMVSVDGAGSRMEDGAGKKQAFEYSLHI